MCCTWFEHNCARATRAYVLEIFRDAVRRLSKISRIMIIIIVIIIIIIIIMIRTAFTAGDRLVGLVVRRPPRERKIPGSNPACLPGAWRYRVSAGTDRPGVSIL